MEEVNHLRGTVERLAGQVRSLYSNGSGGPPGFLEVARAQDEKDKEKLYGVIEKIDQRMDAFDCFVNEQATIRAERKRIDEERAAQIKIDLESANSKLGMRIGKRDLLFAIASLILAVFMAWIGWREYQRKTEATPPRPVVQSQAIPQVSESTASHR